MTAIGAFNAMLPEYPMSGIRGIVDSALDSAQALKRPLDQVENKL